MRRSARRTPGSARPSDRSNRSRRSRQNPAAAQELSRVYNNLAVLIASGAQDLDGLREARPYYERAVRMHQDLTSRDPRNREFKLELAKFSNNFSELLRELSEFALAREHSSRAITLLDELVRPAPSLGHRAGRRA